MLIIKLACFDDRINAKSKNKQIKYYFYCYLFVALT